MRIPDGMMTRELKTQLSTVSTRLARLQLEVASGLRIQRPSDDPGGALRASRLHSGLSQNEEYQRTVKDATSWLKSEDTALGNVQDLLRQIRSTGLQGANPQSTSVRETLALQIESLGVALVQSANSSDGSRFLFAGYKTTTTPFSGLPPAVVSYAGDSGAKNVAILEGVTLELNHSGAEVFNMGGAEDATLPDVFETITALSTAVRDGDLGAVQSNLADLDTHMERIIGIRAETGVRLQQVTIAGERLSQDALLLQDLVSATESTDITEALVDLKEQENLFQAASYVASTIGRGGLLQWLR